MEKIRRQPLPVNPDAIKGFPTTWLCTDIIAPELMDTQEAEIYTFKLYLAPTANINKPEPGYPAHTYDESAFTGRARFAKS